MQGQHDKDANMTFLSILPAAPMERAFTYRGEGAVGQFVRIPFGRQSVTGLILAVDVAPELAESKIKAVETVFDYPPLNEAQIAFIHRMAEWTMIPLGQVLRLHIPSPALLNRPSRKTKASIPPATMADLAYKRPDLNDAQAESAAVLCDLVTARKYETCLLDGVTGAGKTEVFFEAVATALEQGRQAVILMPEIALSNAFIKRFEDRFACAPALWHSEMTPARRRAVWQGVIEGKTRVVLGARSALFLPFQDLGVIVVDEEHDASYKQEEGGIYHARDMAVLRGFTQDIPVILSSATPSLETVQNVLDHRYGTVVLENRFGGASLPDTDVIDMRENAPESGQFMARPLLDAIAETLGQGQQVMLFLNRRGYAPLTLCRACGHRLECPQCTAWLVQHKNGGRSFCHHCDYGGRTPNACPSCAAEESLVPIGPGVERVAEEVAAAFPQAKTVILSSDMEQGVKETLAAIHDGDIDIIIGTQMIAKGHHFPELTLVGVVDADLGLDGGDFRAGERTWQLLHQVAGRAGRGQAKGRVLLQSYQAGSRLLETLTGQDRAAYVTQELKMRELAMMPPFSRLGGIILSDTHEGRVEQAAKSLARAIPQLPGIQILGPAIPPMAMLRGRHRRRFLITAEKNKSIQASIKLWLKDVTLPSTTKMHIDIDPISFF